jgi:regulator of sigma E protease
MGISIIGLIAIIFTFGIAILAHEFGHFLVAKLLGVGVETFSLGMGKKLVKIKKGGTTYCLSAIPFGGYVVLKGALSREMEEQIQKEQKQKEPEGLEVPKEEKKKSLPELVSEDILMLRNKPLPVKIAIYASGVFFNYLIAIITFTVIMMVGVEIPAPKAPVLGYIRPGSFTEKLGVQKGDVVTAVNGKPIENFNQIYEHMDTLMKSNVTTMTLSLKHEKDPATYEAHIPLAKNSPEFRKFLESFNPPFEPYIEEVVYNQPAEKAGIQSGDTIVAVNDMPTQDWMQLVEIIRKSAGVPLRMKIKRGGEYVEKVAIPSGRPEDPKTGQLGIVRGDPNKIIKKLAPAEALSESVITSYRIMEFIVINTYQLFSRFNVREIRENMGGPVAIAIESYRQAKSGLQNYFYFFGTLNIMFLVLNILPLPILDGGHILFSVIEAVFRRPISAKLLVRIYSVMIVLLIALALLVTYNDIIGNLWRIKLW